MFCNIPNTPPRATLLTKASDLLRPVAQRLCLTLTRTLRSYPISVDHSPAIQLVRKEAAEDMVRRNMEILKAKKAQSGVKPAEKTTLDTSKDVISTVLLADIFVVVSLLVWLVVALVPQFASQNDFLLDHWLSLWQPFIDPVLVVLTLGTIVHGSHFHDTAAVVVDVMANAASIRLPTALQALAVPLCAKPKAAPRYAAQIELGACLSRASPRAFTSCNRVADCVSLEHVEATHCSIALPRYTAHDIAAAGTLLGVAVASRAAALTRVTAHAQAQVHSASTPRTDAAVSLVLRWTDVGNVNAAVLLSGGVDSAFALQIAQRSGRRLHAFYL
eukprot:IDg68t1